MISALAPPNDYYRLLQRVIIIIIITLQYLGQKIPLAAPRFIMCIAVIMKSDIYVYVVHALCYHKCYNW